MSDEYQVGYGKPPKHSQFKKGRSGNPRGRPKGSKNLATDVREVLALPVPISEGGKQSTVSTQMAMLMRLREQALKGDARAMDRFLTLAQAHGPDDTIVGSESAPAPDDQAIIDRFLKRQQTASDPEDSA